MEAQASTCGAGQRDGRIGTTALSEEQHCVQGYEKPICPTASLTFLSVLFHSTIQVLINATIAEIHHHDYFFAKSC
jgi:hypothetical protein